jgi:hypothetical protein
MAFLRFKKLYLAFFLYVLLTIDIKNVNATTGYASFPVSIKIASSCAVNIDKPNSISFGSNNIKITSNIILICNNETEASIKIIKNNLKEPQNQILVLDFKKNNKITTGFIYDSFVQVTANTNIQTDAVDENLFYQKINLENENKLTTTYVQNINNKPTVPSNIEDVTVTIEIRY